MTPALTPVSTAHAALLAGMHRICFVEPWDAGAMAELLAMPGAFGFLAGATAPEGFILARTAVDEAEILTILVLPPFRRQGLATRLIAAAAAAARTAGARALFLEVAADNAAGLALYARQGFRQVGVRPRYYRATVDALLMRKDLA